LGGRGGSILARAEEEAADKFRQALQSRPDDPNNQNNLAYALAESGRNLDEALRLAESAMRAAPREPSYADTVAVIYLKKKLPDAALQTLENVGKSVPDNPTYLYHLALAQMDTGRKVEARATAALARKPSKSESAQIREALDRASR
jgi:tetratricopeptide (TPR) repeat protein